MKRKIVNVVTTNQSEEEASEDEQQLTDDNSELDEDESVVDSDEEDDGSEDEALDASATDSDDDESDDDQIDDNDEDEDVEPPKSKSEIIKDEILQRYHERQGKQLYIRFPLKAPETQEALEEKIKELTPLAIKVHKPRQKHVRFCLVDFATKEDRDTALKEITKSIKKGDFDKYVVNIPRTESLDFVNELAERKIKSLENKKAKQRLKKASKKSLKENNFTSTVIVLNLPKTASLVQIRELFTNAVDINIKPGKGKMNKDKCIAAITLPTTMAARNAIKNKFSLGGNQLIIKFDNQKLKKKRKTNNKKDAKITPPKNEEAVSEVSKPPTSKKPKLETPSNVTKEKTFTEKVPMKNINSNKNKNANKNAVKNKKKIVTK